MARMSCIFICIMALLQEFQCANVPDKNYVEPPADCIAKHLPDPTKDALGPSFTREELQAARIVALKAHNHFRELHGAPPLSLSDDLNEKALHQAECMLKWTTWGDFPPGMNGFIGDVKEPYNITSLAQIKIDSWYETYCNGAFQNLVRHRFFKRIVWRSTTQIGVGFARSNVTKDGITKGVVIIRYSPAPEEYNTDEMAEVGEISSALDNAMCCRRQDAGKGQMLKYNTPENGPCIESKDERPPAPPSGKPEDFVEPPSDCSGEGWPSNTGATLDTPWPNDDIAAGRRAALGAHNSWRELHGAPPVTLSDELNVKSQHMADCAIKWRRWGTYPSNQNNFAGNIQEPYNVSLLAQNAVDSWYAGACLGTSSTFGRNNFARIVWKSTTQIGIGFARNTVIQDGWRHGSVAVVRYNNAPMDYGGGLDGNEVGTLAPALDKVVCCRREDPKLGQLWKLNSKEHGPCWDNYNAGGNNNNGGGNNGGWNNGGWNNGGWNNGGGNNGDGRIWPWPKWRTGQEIPGFGGLGMWGYSGFYSASNKTLWDS